MNFHYVYRITNKKVNMHYYGCRTSLEYPILDLGIKYFSSSSDKKFIKEQRDNPINFKYKVIKICQTRNDAVQLEIRLHKRFNVGVNESFYNKAKQTSIGWDTSGTKRHSLSEETKQKISKANLGRIISETGRKNISNGCLGRVHSDMTKRLMSIAHSGNTYCLGNSHSEETKQKMIESQKHRWKSVKILTCPHCGKEGRGGAMYQWHFDNCRGGKC